MEFKFPDVGEGIQEGVIVKWYVKVGDTVKRDDVLCEVETDKAIVEIPSPNEGVIDELFHKEGDTIQVGEVLAKYHAEEAEESERKDSGAGAVGSIQDADDLGENKGPLFDNLKKSGAMPVQNQQTEIKVLPAIRRLAEELNVDLATVKGSGDGGRITKEDVKAAANTDSPAPAASKPMIRGEVDYQPFTGMRKATAAHLQKAHDSVIPVSSTHLIDVTELAAYRKSVNLELAESGVKLSFLPFIFKALTIAIKDYPNFNAEFDEAKQQLILKNFVNLAVAIDAPEGLFVPVIKGAQKLSLSALAKEITRLAEGVKDRALKPDEMMGSSITVTNYGSLGTYVSTPIINYPNTAILGVGAIQKVAKFVDKQVMERSMLPLTLTFDHRFADGADAARFLNKMKVDLEDNSIYSAWSLD